MKKLLAMTLACAMLLLLCACGNRETISEKERVLLEKYGDLIALLEAEKFEEAAENVKSHIPVPETEPGGTTQETQPEDLPQETERERLEKDYQIALYYLNSYIKDEMYSDLTSFDDYEHLYHNDAATQPYKLFSDLGDYKRAPEILSRFSKTEDVLLAQRLSFTDAFGYTVDVGDEMYITDENGRIVQELRRGIFYTYNEQGLLEAERETIELIDGPRTESLKTYTYDEHQNLLTKETLYDTGYLEKTTCAYTYDSRGRILTSVTDGTEGIWEGVSDYESHYFYDENGRLSRIYSESLLECRSVLYTYNKQGQVVREEESVGKRDKAEEEFTFSDPRIVTEYVYEGERLMRKTITWRTVWVSTYEYGTRYDFDSHGLFIPEGVSPVLYK